MIIKLDAYIEKFTDAKYAGWIDHKNTNIKGIVVQGNSIEEVYKQLLLSLKVKIAYDYGVEILDIQEKEEEDIPTTMEVSEKQNISLTLA